MIYLTIFIQFCMGSPFPMLQTKVWRSERSIRYRRETTYIPEKAAYEYRPRGFYEVEYPDIPYPEVVSYTENQDGTITLIVNAVYPNGNTSMAYSHKTVIRPLEEDCFQYVSNQMMNLIDEHDIWWHSNRLTKEEWIEIYGGTE